MLAVLLVQDYDGDCDEDDYAAYKGPCVQVFVQEQYSQGYGGHRLKGSEDGCHCRSYAPVSLDPCYI